MERPRGGHSVHDQAWSADVRSSHSTYNLVLTESLGDYIRDDPDLAADSASIMEKLGNEAFEAVLNRWLTQQQQQAQPHPDTAGSHHYYKIAETGGPATVTGLRIPTVPRTACNLLNYTLFVRALIDCSALTVVFDRGP
jgi:hypothetical protein